MDHGAITRLLGDVRAGRADAIDALANQVLAELRAMAHAQLRRERAAALQTTELVNEAWLRLAGDGPPDFASRAHFFHAAATAMRRVLVDLARRRRAAKRGAGVEAVAAGDALDSLAGSMTAALDADGAGDVEALHAALSRLEQLPGLAERARVVELRWFAGLTVPQVAEILQRSAASVKRDWEFCRAWLARELAAGRG